MDKNHERLLEVKAALDAYFAKHGLKMSREGIKDASTGELLHSCVTLTEYVQFGLVEVDKRAGRATNVSGSSG